MLLSTQRQRAPTLKPWSTSTTRRRCQRTSWLVPLVAQEERARAGGPNWKNQGGCAHKQTHHAARNPAEARGPVLGLRGGVRLVDWRENRRFLRSRSLNNLASRSVCPNGVCLLILKPVSQEAGGRGTEFLSYHHREDGRSGTATGTGDLGAGSSDCTARTPTGDCSLGTATLFVASWPVLLLRQGKACWSSRGSEEAQRPAAWL